MFPVEIWEEILKHGRAKDLSRLRAVSKTWDTIIPKILEGGDIWYRQCVEDIPNNMWSLLLEYQFDINFKCQDFHKEKNNPRVWLRMYKSWRQWQTIFTKTPVIGTFRPMSRPRPCIISVAALNNVIAIGDADGSMFYYDIITDKIFHRNYHPETLRQMQLLRKGELIIAVSTSINFRNRFWNLTKKVEEKALCCTGPLMTSNFGYFYLIRNQRLAGFKLSESIDGNAELSKNLLQMLVWEDDLNLVRQILADGDDLAAMGGDGNDVTLLTDKNKHIRVSYKCEAAMKAESRVLNEPRIRIRYCRIFKAQVAVCVGVFGEFGFSINGGHWKIYNLYNKFNAHVTTVVFHVTILALGLQSGDVYLFPIENVECLMNLNFDTIPSRKLILDRQPITSLNVTECDSTQYLIAASKTNVHIVKFT